MPGFRLIGPEGQVYLIHAETTFGRDAQCSYSLDDPQISRRHVTFYEVGDNLMVRDEGSANGTYINGRRMTSPVALSPGDEIRIGGTVLTVPGGTAAVGSAAANVSPAPASKAARRSRLPLVIGGCALVGLCAVVAVAALAFLPRSGVLANLPSFGASSTASDYSLDQALTEDAVDDRPDVLAYLGRPDAFTISQIVVDGVPVRVESWRYYGFGTRVDFVDGEAAWTIDIDPVPDDTLLPAWYDPLAFDLGMSPSEAALVASSESPAGMSPEAVDLADGGEDLAGASMLVGDQIVIGLDPAGVVYVETMALFPAEEGG